MSGAEDKLFRLSKSMIAAYEHCPKRLWLQIHRRDAGKFDKKTLMWFRFGHDVGRKARFALEDGVLVDTGFDMPAAIARTKELIAAPQRRPIFEATFQHEGVLIRADILLPDEGGTWRVVEVKASSRPKAYQYADVATQVWTIANSGVEVSRAVIRHVANPICWRRPDIAAVTFRDADVSAPVRRALRTRAATAVAARQAVLGTEPQRPIGMHCYRPFACEFRDHCRAAANIPPLKSPPKQVARRCGSGETST
jgi:CRISPR/Cas system-associated exonuclease Cas4 (RecB family)